jgi:bifunctional non-homologous end joining protein LigD
VWLREIFEHFKLESFPKTSGSKGMQIYVPLNTKTSYDETKPFANALARLLENEHRDLVVSDMKKAIRTNKIFVDWSQNDEHKTTISVYSLRARERPTVSTPITWEEVEHALKKKDAGLLVFESDKTLERVEKMGDLFAPLLKLKQKLPKLTGIESSTRQESGVELAAQAEGGKPRQRKPAGKTEGKSRARRKV